MNKKNAIVFNAKSFCFTGKLAELKRTQVEREARARGAQTSKIVNERLDYLVIGSIPSTGWKHGSYGTKIEKARKIAPDNNGRPQLVPESEFMEALARHPEINSGEIDAKVIVCKYKFLAKQDDFDHETLEDWLLVLQESQHCHVTVYVEDASIYGDLFKESSGIDDLEDLLIVQIRIVKQVPLEAKGQSVADDIARGFEGVEGVDGRLEWFERKEGTAGYIRLLNEIPQNLRSRKL
ncbi:MAG: BRCT domain-containing protein [Fibrobacteria bacterium]|nr:BRCT domain-containing protein [Fibrobacteria bacterium]